MRCPSKVMPFAIAWVLASTVIVNASSVAAEDVFVYSTRSDNQVHFVSAAKLASVAKVDATLGAHELSVSPDGRWVIGSAYGGPGPGHQPADKRLVVIDAKSRSVHRVIDLQVERPNDIAFLPGGRQAIVTVEAPPRLVRLDPESGEFTLITLKQPANHMLALHPNGKLAYVAHVMPGSISVVNLDTGETIATIDTPTVAEGITCSPDGKRLWVACNRADAICIIDTVTNAVSQTIIAKGFPFRMRFSPDGRRVAVSFPGAGEVRLFDANDHTQVVQIDLRKSEEPEVPVQPTSIAFSPDGLSLAAVCDSKQPAGPELVRIDVANALVTHRISTDATPDALSSGSV